MTIKKFCEKIILIILTISILLSFMATPVANAGLKLKEGEFYYSGTTKGTYTISQGIFSWLIDNLGKIADWILGLITMGVRMVFVGWTALFEKLLTWAIESSSGMNASGAPMVDSTDLTALGDSSGNITVQAIVYNQVPLFDINFFKLEVDKTVNGTGQKLICSSCRLECENCCEIIKNQDGYTRKLKQGVDCNCISEEQSCDACKRYLANWNAEKPLVIQIREFVAMWYTIIRLLSMIAMLIALLGIGIKMALSTVASEKAVYKRMLIDWVVGMIILFAIHYMIYFIISMNETLVNTVKETANSINKTQIQFVNSGEKSKDDESVQEVSNEEIELNVYEEIRTRAYDPKLSVGLSGMIMYMTLIYFAVRYSIVYLKRYLTVIVLSLMAPPLGVAYALQKALTGKSSSLKKWWTEFTMTVIIQIVHALIYAVFISTALTLSMVSIPGMIVALIFMNFALKAEKLFRQIFKMGDGDSLAGSMAESGDAEKMQSNIKNIASTAKAARPIANALMNNPVMKGVKTAGKIGLAAGAGVGAGILQATKKAKGDDTTENNDSDDSTSNDNPPQGGAGNTLGTANVGKESSEAPTMKQEEELQKLMGKGGDTLRMEAAQGALILKNPNASATQKEEAQKSINDYFTYQQLMRNNEKKKGRPLDASESSFAIFGGHVKKAINITNRYQASVVDKPEIADNKKFKHMRKIWRGAAQGYRTAMGTKHYDAKTGKMVYDGNGYYSQFGLTKLLGLSAEDKKFIKTEAMKPLKGIAGAAGMFIGLSTMVAHPGLGGAAFTVGRNKYRQGFKQPAGQKAYKGRYGKAKFPAATAQSMQKELLKQAYDAIRSDEAILDSEMIKNVRMEHPELYKAIMQDLKEGGDYSGIRISGTISPRNIAKFAGKGVNLATYTPKKWARVSGILNTSAFGDSMDKIDKFALARERKELAAIEKEGATSLKIAYQQEMSALLEQQDKKIAEDKELQEQAFFEEIVKDASNSKLQEYIKKCEELGFSYNSETKKLENRKIDENSFSNTEKTKTPESREQIEKTIEQVIQDMYKVSGKVEDTEAETNQALQLVANRLKSAKILDAADKIDVLFKDGDTAKTVVRDKINTFNKQTIKTADTGKIDEAISEKNGFSESERKLIQQIVLENGIDGLDAEKIMDKVSVMADSGTKQPVTQSKPKSKNTEKGKLTAIDDFLKKASATKIPQITADEASKKAIKDTITDEDRKKIKHTTVKKSRQKIKKVLQFMAESEDSDLVELMDSTEKKVKSAREGVKVGEEVLEFNDTEADSLKRLFEKMKEEVVFNQFTKNVLDQKDSKATQKAKQALYTETANYLREKQEAIRNEEKVNRVVSENSKYGVNSSNVTDLISGKIGGKELVETLEKEGRIDAIYSGEFGGTVEDPQKKSKLASYIDKELGKGELPELKAAQDKYSKAEAKYLKAKKKSILTGKIDIYSQLDKLDQI